MLMTKKKKIKKCPISVLLNGTDLNTKTNNESELKVVAKF